MLGEVPSAILFVGYMSDRDIATEPDVSTTAEWHSPLPTLDDPHLTSPRVLLAP